MIRSGRPDVGVRHYTRVKASDAKSNEKLLKLFLNLWRIVRKKHLGFIANIPMIIFCQEHKIHVKFAQKFAVFY